MQSQLGLKQSWPSISCNLITKERIMSKTNNEANPANKHLLIRLLPYLIVCIFLITSCYYYMGLKSSYIKGSFESQVEYKTLDNYSNYLNNIQTLLIKILNMPSSSKRDIIFQELEETINEWKDDNSIALIQPLKKFVTDTEILKREIDNSFSEIINDNRRKAETLERIATLKNEIENDINNVKSIVSNLPQSISELNINYFREIEKALIKTFLNNQIQNQTSSKALKQNISQFNTLLKNNIELIQNIFNCRIYVQSIKDFILSVEYSKNASNINTIKNNIDALFNNIQMVLNQFDHQKKLNVLRDKLRTCKDLINQLIDYKISKIESGSYVETEQDPKMLSLKNKVLSNIELMTYQLKQYKDIVEQQERNDLSTQIKQFIHLMDTSTVDDHLNEIRSNLNHAHSLYHIQNLVYELIIKMNLLLTPNSKNVSLLTEKEIRPLYNNLKKAIAHSRSLRKLFSKSNYYNLMKEINLIIQKIEELSRIKTELESIQKKLNFEVKNKEYVITNAYISSNQSLIKILQSIQAIEKKIFVYQSRIKEQNIEQLNQNAHQMIIWIVIFSILLISSLLLRYYFQKRDFVMQADSKDAGVRLKVSVQRKLIFSAIFLLIISLSFNALLTLGSLEKLYVESTVSQYQIIGTDLQRNIDRSLRYGKRIEKFVRIDKILSETQYSLTKKYFKDQTQWQDIDLNVSISLPDWNTIYSTNKDFIGKQIPQRAQVNYSDLIKDHDTKNLSNWTRYKDRYYITLPVKGGENKDWAGTIIIDFNDTQIKTFLQEIFVNNMKMIAGILVLGSIFLIISIYFIINRSTNKLPKILISIVMLLIIGVSQAVFSLINSSEFKKFYLQINIQKAEIMTTMLKEDIDYLLSKGVKIHKLVKMENLLKEVIDVSPELKDISIYDSNNKLLHLANKDHAIDFIRSNQAFTETDLSHSKIDPKFQLKKKLIQISKDDDSSQSIFKGTILTNISKEALFNKIFEIRFDSATVLVISFLFMVELLIMIFRIIRSSSNIDGAKTKIEFSDIRPVMFIFFFSFDLCISFLPLYMEQLYIPMFGLSKDIVLSLHISGEMFFAGITAIIVGWLLDRVNWHLPFIYGLIICSIGSFYSWLSPDAYHLLFSRCLTGIGYGLAFMAGQGFVVSYTDSKTKTQGLTQLFAGLMAGSICGGAAGAMIADRIGYGPIFFISGVLLIVTVLYTLYFMRAGFKKKEVLKKLDKDGIEKDKQGLSLVFNFIFNRNILSLLILGILPTAFSIVGYINFFYPVYLNRLGETQSNIGRVYMIYGLCLIYIAPLLSKFVDRSDNKKLFIVITGLIGGLAFTSYYFIAGIWATIITVLLLGISSSFDASRTYALNLKITKTLGEGTAMGIFNLAEKIGQVVGPIIFGLFFITANVNKTMAAFGIIYIIITLLFLVTAQSDKKIKQLNR